MYSMFLNYTFEIIKMAKFMSCIFYHNRKKKDTMNTTSYTTRMAIMKKTNITNFDKNVEKDSYIGG